MRRERNSRAEIEFVATLKPQIDFFKLVLHLNFTCSCFNGKFLFSNHGHAPLPEIVGSSKILQMYIFKPSKMIFLQKK